MKKDTERRILEHIYIHSNNIMGPVCVDDDGGVLYSVHTLKKFIELKTNWNGCFMSVHRI